MNLATRAASSDTRYGRMGNPFKLGIFATTDLPRPAVSKAPKLLSASRDNKFEIAKIDESEIDFVLPAGLLACST